MIKSNSYSISDSVRLQKSLTGIFSLSGKAVKNQEISSTAGIQSAGKFTVTIPDKGYDNAGYVKEIDITQK